jgi:gas vesicle protein
MTGKFFTYVTLFIFGAAAGATYAMLNTTQSGKKNRAQLRKEVTHVRSRTKKALSKAQARTMDKLDHIQNLIQEISDEAMHQTDRLREVSQQIAAKPREMLKR